MDMDILLQEYIQGESLNNICKKYNCKYSTLYKAISSMDNFTQIQQHRNECVFNQKIQHILDCGSDIKLNIESDHRLLLGEWKGRTTDKYAFLCKKCNKEWVYTQFTYVYNNNGVICKSCMQDKLLQSKTIPFNQVLDIVRTLGSDIRTDKTTEMKENEWRRVIDKYWFKCPQCSTWFNREYRDAVADKCLCHKCGNRPHYIHDIGEVQAYCLSVGSKFLSDIWKNKGCKYDFQCVDCGCVITKTFEKFASGQVRCKECSNRVIGDKIKHTHQWYLNELKNKGITITPLEEYAGIDKAICHVCPNCGDREWKARPYNILTGKSSNCMRCIGGNSKTQKNIEEYLTEIGVAYEKEYTFDNLINPKTGRKLRFDLAIFNNNKLLQGLIEYDGEYHYKTTNINPIEKLMDLRKRDFEKDEYCRVNNIPLLRIPYWEKENIKVIIDKYIQSLEE